jgi:hypothetical protein
MEIIDQHITIDKLKQMAKSKFGNLVKAVIDIELEIMAIDAELHADEEQQLIENGSQQKDLWGINIYPEENKDNWIEFDSMINLRPAQGNTSRSITSLEIQNKIHRIVNKLIQT